ncbi:hypothetical protein FOA52_009063 [Chlamydomonas sp. UWO 241]|nr:hypothetical protein FOA52_009063 [Chlamydomonas sp. UWO 241]
MARASPASSRSLALAHLLWLSSSSTVVVSTAAVVIDWDARRRAETQGAAGGGSGAGNESSTNTTAAGGGTNTTGGGKAGGGGSGAGDGDSSIGGVNTTGAQDAAGGDSGGDDGSTSNITNANNTQSGGSGAGGGDSSTNTTPVNGTAAEDASGGGGGSGAGDGGSTSNTTGGVNGTDTEGGGSGAGFGESSTDKAEGGSGAGDDSSTNNTGAADGNTSNTGGNGGNTINTGATDSNTSKPEGSGSNTSNTGGMNGNTSNTGDMNGNTSETGGGGGSGAGIGGSSSSSGEPAAGGVQTPPEAGMEAMPLHKSFWYPGPPPINLSQPFDLSLPAVGPIKYFWEAEPGLRVVYRTPQNRHVWGPLPTLPSVLLMETTINIGNFGTDPGTQGAIFFHQEVDYYGGPEMGWVYFGNSGTLSHYFCGNCNCVKENSYCGGTQGQRWRSRGTKADYLGSHAGFRLEFGRNAKGERTMRSQLYNVANPSSSKPRYDLNETWPDWMEMDPRYNPMKPWYVTMTWQRHDDSDVYGNATNTSLWITEIRVYVHVYGDGDGDDDGDTNTSLWVRYD